MTAGIAHERAEPAWRPLKALLGGAIEVPEDVEVADLTLDSHAVRRGAAFLACRGRTRHGLDFAGEAVAAGARAVLWEPAPGVVAPQFPPPVLVVAVPGLSAQAGFIADRFFGAPSARLAVTGITGTNGKTTSAWLLAAALTAGGRSCAYLGTLGSGPCRARSRPSTHTTPDAVTLHRQLAALRDAGAQAVAMEVSSHALDQQRCNGVRFQIAVFTNLSRDHLDYHGDMAAYARAKGALFDWPTLAARVINVDDPIGQELAARAPRGAALVMTARRSDPAQLAPGARYVRALRSEHRPRGLELHLDTSWGTAQLRSGLLGDFNADNLLTVLGVLLASGFELAPACELLAQCQAPPGRMQLAGGGALPLAIVDYAHTPDALENALRAARAHCARAAALRVRLRRRSRSRQAPADGPHRRDARRRAVRDRRQSARRGSASHRRRHPRGARRATARAGAARSRGGDRRGRERRRRGRCRARGRQGPRGLPARGPRAAPPSATTSRCARRSRARGAA